MSNFFELFLMEATARTTQPNPQDTGDRLAARNHDPIVVQFKVSLFISALTKK